LIVCLAQVKFANALVHMGAINVKLDPHVGEVRRNCRFTNANNPVAASKGN
jgi:hypothetical protein